MPTSPPILLTFDKPNTKLSLSSAPASAPASAPGTADFDVSNLGIDPKRRQNVKSFNRRWSAILGSRYIDRFSPDVLATVQQLDRDRIAAGKSGYTTKDAARALVAAQTRKPITPEPADDRNFLERGLDDLMAMGKGLVHLPGVLADQVWQIGTDFGEGVGMIARGDFDEWTKGVRQAYNEGASWSGGPISGVGNVLKGLAETPAGAFVPGATTYANVVEKGLAGATEHPLLTALDVLPIAGKLAKMTGPGVALAEAGQTMRNPIRQIATRTVNDAGGVVTRPWVQAASEAANLMPPLRRVRTLWGSDASKLAVLQADAEGGLRNAVKAENEAFVPAAVREAHGYEGLRDAYAAHEAAGLSPERAAELTRIAVEGDPAVIGALSEADQAIIKGWRDTEAKLAASGEALGTLTRHPGTGEIYAGGAAKTLTEYAARRTRAATKAYSKFVDVLDKAVDSQGKLRPGYDPAFNDVLRSVADGDFAAAQDLLNKLGRKRTGPLAADVAHMSARDARNLSRWWAQGPGIVEYKISKLTPTQAANPYVVQALQDDWQLAAQRFARKAMPTMDRWRVSRAAANDITRGHLEDFMESAMNGGTPVSWTNARGGTVTRTASTDWFEEMFKSQSKEPFTPKGGQSAKVITLKQFNELSSVLDDAVAKERKLVMKERLVVPPRWDALVHKNTVQAIREMAKQAGPEALAHAERRIAAHDYAGAIPLTDEAQAWMARTGKKARQWQDKAFQAISREQKLKWQDWKAEGFDPVHLHRVDPETARFGVLAPKITGTVRAGSYAKERALDWASPHLEDLGAAQVHQGMEMLKHQVAENFGKEVAETWGTTFADQEARMIRLASDTGKPIETILSKRYDLYDPKALRVVDRPRMADFYKAGDRSDSLVLIPKHIGEVLRQMENPTRGMTARIFEPLMAVFRTAVVPLSPRSQINNIVGNSFMTAGRDPLSFLHGRRAYRLMTSISKEGEASLLQDLLGISGRDLDEVIASKGWQRFVSEIGSTRSDLDELAFLAGVKARHLTEMMDRSAVGHAVLTAGAPARATGRLLGKVADRSMWLNGWVDDLNRSMVMIRNLRKELASGKAPSVAAENALAEVRKIALNWKAMTPLERSLLRPIVPFYSWSKHIVKYVLSYPFDKPYAAALMANLMQTEYDDQMSGLPETLANLFFVGGPHGRPGKAAEQTAVNIGGMNPFAGLGSSFGFLGFLAGDPSMAGEAMGSVNPVLKTLLQTIGIDPRMGQADLFPDLKYDPQTGSLRMAPTGNPVSNLLFNTIPQSQGMADLLGLSQDYQELASQNPSAALRGMLGAFGIPVLWRKVPVAAAYAKSELARSESESRAWNAAVRSGRWREVGEQWPGLAERARKTDEAVKALTREQRLMLGVGLTPGAARAAQAQVAALTVSAGGPAPQDMVTAG